MFIIKTLHCSQRLFDGIWMICPLNFQRMLQHQPHDHGSCASTGPKG